jgi:hypothetical protein
MNRIKEHHIMAAICFIVMGTAIVHDVWLYPPADAASTDIPRHALYLMEMTPDKFVHPQPDPDGQWVLFDSVQPAIDAAVAEAVANCSGTGATTAWATAPPTQDELQLLCEVRTGVYAFRDYINGQWRVGVNAGPAPLAWARINARVAE